MDKREKYSPVYPDLWDEDEMFHLVTMWTIDVWNKRRDVDPNNESKWGDLAMGYGLGKGLDPDRAFDFELFLSHLRLI